MTDKMDGGPAVEMPAIPETTALSQQTDNTGSRPVAQPVRIDAAVVPQGDADISIDFLHHWRPEGPWVLTAITQEQRGIASETFRPGQEDEIRKWIEPRLGKDNIYFTVNPLMKDISGVGKKAAKTDVKSMDWFHVDLDPRPMPPGGDIDEHNRKERERALGLLRGFVTPPTVIVDSGGGYQGFWKLTEPQIINGDEVWAKELEAYNIQLEVLLGADACHDCCRIMRLPGTLNVPTEKKLKKGRKIALASVVEADWGRVYPITAFTLAQPSRSSCREFFTSGPAVMLPDSLPKISLDTLPEGVTARTKMLIVQGGDPDEPERYQSRSEACWAVCCELVRAGCTDDQIASIILDRDFGISAHVLAQNNFRKYAVRQIDRARQETATGQSTIVGGGMLPGHDEEKPTPMKLAKIWLDRRKSRLIRYDGEWWTYENGAYRTCEDEAVRAEVWRVFQAATSGIINNILDAAKGEIHFNKNKFLPPCWLDDGPRPVPDKLLVVRNGILDLETGTLTPHTDQFFTLNALDFDYDANAPTPKRFLQLIDEIWPDATEKETHTTLQMMFGYMLTADTSHQKIFLLVGPPRGGKSTLGRLLERLLGSTNTCSPTFSSMSNPFGKQCMIGKQLALVSDMRIGRHTDKAAIAETLLSISGEDTMNVSRKHLEDWKGKLKVRFVILSNEPPTLDDPSNALLSRFIILQSHQTFAGREDRDLDRKLASELPGILNWAISGWRALRECGRFVQPASSAEMKDSITRIASPIAAFVEDECEIDSDGVVTKDEAHSRFKEWCRTEDRDWHGNKETFSKGLLASCPSIRPSKERRGDERVPVFRGLRLKPAPF